ncbi:CapA family protein [Pseudomonas indica]|uniref:Poly-gamma-glutamate synthesis protein (Capsule biosynthesis protein) n=1 Tax=Pseudomonas indica TaxID=137658 RepID=A0A1G9BV05_9PSED|nr:poly-gamma-glutamate synthesis protein (capsule biosynthesis protein) [Pseudomonas indica]
MPDVRPHLRLFLGGDLMTARGIDQILPNPGDPLLHEAYVTHAGDYVALAERRNGPIPRPVDFAYVWGVVPQVLARHRPDVSLVNLETAVTRGGWPQPKGINYRMEPNNLPVLGAVKLDCCSLANNHVLDWGEAGLLDTLAALDHLGLGHAGAGVDRRSATAPAVLPVVGGRRLLVFAFATPDCGVPSEWSADDRQPGVAWLSELSPRSLNRIATRIRALKRPGDRVLVSLHWGGNWDFSIPTEQVRFAHGLIDEAGVDLVHGHSSHHVKGIEVYHRRLILYGCGDLLDDYEGIDGYASYRSDLGLLYFPSLDAKGNLLSLLLYPTHQCRLSIQAAEDSDRVWLLDTLQRECARFGCSVIPTANDLFRLVWREARH